LGVTQPYPQASAMGRAIRYIFFALFGAKKDAASIPNAA